MRVNKAIKQLLRYMALIDVCISSADKTDLLIVMSYVPHNNLDAIMLSALLNHGERHFDEKAVRKLLKQASEESMLMLSVDGSYKFAHDRIRQASV